MTSFNLGTHYLHINPHDFENFCVSVVFLSMSTFLSGARSSFKSSTRTSYDIVSLLSLLLTTHSHLDFFIDRTSPRSFTTGSFKYFTKCTMFLGCLCFAKTCACIFFWNRRIESPLFSSFVPSVARYVPLPLKTCAVFPNVIYRSSWIDAHTVSTSSVCCYWFRKILLYFFLLEYYS